MSDMRRRDPSIDVGLMNVERARAYIALAKSTDEVKDVRDKAEAIRRYLRARGASTETQNDAAEVRMWAERKLGELTRELPKAKGGGEKGVGRRGKNAVASCNRIPTTPTLAEQGIAKIDAHRWQKLADIAEPAFTRHVAEVRAKGERLTTGAAIKLARQESKAALAEELRAKPPPPVSGHFDVIVIDPPWQYAKRAEDITHRGRNPYPDMSTEAICALPVAARAERDCTLWLWTTNAFMRDAFRCLDAWGFAEKTILTWVKDRMGTGDWLRGKTEHCILATRGKPTVVLTNQTTALLAPLREHSRKPDEFYALVEALCPGTRLDMFAREPRNGWVLWGAETETFR